MGVWSDKDSNADLDVGAECGKRSESRDFISECEPSHRENLCAMWTIIYAGPRTCK